MDRRSESRLYVQIPGSYRITGDQPRHMFLSQISASGCRISESLSPLRAGQAIDLHLGQIGPIPAEVRWRDDAQVGVAFVDALDSAVVGFFAAYCGSAEH